MVSDNSGNYKINSYKFAPEITIPTGALTGILEINGIEDDLNSPGEESDESIEISILQPFNAIIEESNTIEDITLTILNNEIDLVLDEDATQNIPAMANSSVAWGDYDRDGDQDLAIIGYSFNTGTVTQLYENVQGVFVNSSPGIFNRAELGDVMWVDYDKDGYIDLVVSGQNENGSAETTIYQNIDGVTFSPSLDLNLPSLYNTLDSGIWIMMEILIL